MKSTIAQLRRLASLYSIQTSYEDVFGVRQAASRETLIGILAARGAPAETSTAASASIRERAGEVGRLIEPVTVLWEGEPRQIVLRISSPTRPRRVELEITLENGEKLSGSRPLRDVPKTSKRDSNRNVTELLFSLDLELPYGYHELAVRVGRKSGRSTLFVAPSTAFREEGRKRWGVFAPTYAIHSERSWGIGDLSDAEELIDWAESTGSEFFSTLPLLAGFLDEPFDRSPYAPASRLFWNEVYLAVETLPDLSFSEEARGLVGSDAFQSELAALRKLPLIDYRAVMRQKRRVLEILAGEFFSHGGSNLEELHRFVDATPRLQQYARFRATMERRGPSFRDWPESWRVEGIPAGEYEPASEHYHLYVQWRMQQQIERLAESRLYLDFPLGTHSEAFDVWLEGPLFRNGASVGAPPDVAHRGGQDWGFPPLDPDRLRDTGYRYLIDAFRLQMRHASILRIDHVMGLHRLYWVPSGLNPAQGAYVQYAADELYAILAIESRRYGTVVVGEDLGTVPPYVRETMQKRGFHRLFVVQRRLYQEKNDPPGQPTEPEVTSLNTHDMFPFAAYWNALDIEDRMALGLVEDEARERTRREEVRQALVGFLNRHGQPRVESFETADVAEACWQFLSSSDSDLFLVNLEDLWLETNPQNIPTTTDERPNWERRLHYGLEEIDAADRLRIILEQIEEARRTMKNPGSEPPAKRPEKASNQQPDSTTLLSDQDLHLFNEGTHYQLYRKLGAHRLERNGVTGVNFAVWAPAAAYVSVIGAFNGWNKETNPLSLRESSGIWEGFVPKLGKGEIYKYHIVSKLGGYRVDKTDPFGIFQEVAPKTASVVWDLDYEWGDQKWMKERRAHNGLNAPMSIYEVHLGSWRRVQEEGNRSLSYREMAHQLAEYVKQTGFTHVELLPVMEHPFFGSWGYQVTGFFAPSSRYGTPQDFMYLVDYLHQQGIGVILDWVPSHFPTDEHGLSYFDGTHLFEHADPRQGFHPDWGSLIFNYGRNEVRSFLSSSAFYWLDQFHADGLRLDAVASMLYLDYSRKAGEWIPNQYGGRENIEAISFLRQLNEAIYREKPDVISIAEESTAWPMVSRPTYVGGLGFGMKWDMGWMHDTLKYFSHDPIHRKYHHGILTFRMLYAFTENFVLPLSHDEVVHGKGSLLGKMPGDDWQRFANLRALFAYMYAQPGKKLIFMGGELAQRREWNHDGSLDWHLLDDSRHAGVHRWLSDLNRAYTQLGALHEVDFEGSGFEWIDCNDAEQSVISLLRHGKSDESPVMVVFNLTPRPRHNYMIGAPRGGWWREILNSDATIYGGSGQGNLGLVEAVPIPLHGRRYSLNLTIPPLGAVFLVPSEEVVEVEEAEELESDDDALV